MLSLLFLFFIAMLANAWPTEKPQSTTVRSFGKCRWQEDGSLKVKLDEEKDIMKFAPDKIPENVKGKPLTGKLQFSMNAARDTIYSIIPVEGAFKAKFDSIQTGKDEKLPSPKHITGEGTNKRGDKYKKDFWQFIPLVRILDEEWAGVVVPYFLKYDPFYMGKDDNGQPIAGVKMSPSGEKVLEFMETLGITATPLPWSDNLLPEIMKRALAADRTFRIVMKKAFIDSVLSEEGVDFNDPSEDDDFEEEKKE